MSFQTSLIWLKTSSILLIILGALFSWTTTGPLAGVNLALVDFVVLPLDGEQSYNAVETRLLAAIAGGLTAGFGMAFWVMTQHIYAENPVLGRRVILSSIMTWFVIDGIGSVLSGVAFNVVANLSFLAMFVLPVLLVKPEQNEQPA